MIKQSLSSRVWLLLFAIGLMIANIIAFAELGIMLRFGFITIISQTIIVATILTIRIINGKKFRLALDIAEIIFLFWIITLGASLSQYWIAAITTGYNDSILAAADAKIGFDWVSLYSFTINHPSVGHFEQFFYRSIFWFPILMLISLVSSNKTDHAEKFLAAYIFSLFVTLSVFYVFPTQSALMYHIGHDRLYRPVTDLTYIDIFDALRNSQYSVISTDSLNGFVSFPSFHAVFAILLIWASWPILWLRKTAFILNVAVLVSTPVEGSHYLIDVIAGVAVGIGAIFVITRYASHSARIERQGILQALSAKVSNFA